MVDNREKLTNSEIRLLNLIYKYGHRKLNMNGYARLMGATRRWTRMCLSELRKKGYVKVYPESMKIHKSQTCKYVVLGSDGKPLIN